MNHPNDLPSPKLRPQPRQPKLRRRESLEIIIDTCSLGKPQLEGLSKLIAYAEQASPKIFDDVHIVIPIQIGTEVRQRVFPEFLKAELTKPSGKHLENFFQRHQPQIEVVETDISYGYKFLYAAKAAQLLQKDEALMQEVAKEAQLLLERYTPRNEVPMPRITSLEVKAFCEDAVRAGTQQQAALSHSRQQAQGANLKQREVRTNAAPHLIEMINMGRHGQRFLEPRAGHDRYILQAMYSNPTLYKQISTDGDFKRFRRNKGERAIENFLYDEREKTNPNRVSLVISDDEGARASIQRLRSRSQNSIFVVSSWGLALALKQLKLVPSLDRVVDPSIIEKKSAEQKHLREQATNGEEAEFHRFRDPAVERKWAHRLVQMMKYGDWLPQRKQETPTR